MKRNSTENDAFLIGFATGLRSMTPLAVLARAAARGRIVLPAGLDRFAAPRVAAALSVAQGIELIADKLPFTPSRLERRGLIIRAWNGALTGAIVTAAAGKPAWKGVVPGVLGAMAGSFAGFQGRVSGTDIACNVAEHYGVSPAVARFAVAAIEDGICAGLSMAVVAHFARPEDDAI